jgi:hypothetical protein
MRRLILALSAVVLLGCHDNTGPSGVPDAQLHVIRQDAGAPPLVGTQASFWAKVGDGREVRLEYQGASPGVSGEDFLRFEVPGDGLMRKPDGGAFQPGDSILITLTVVDPVRFLFQFEPSGLQFSPDHPARLKIRYLHSDHDFNEDGVTNAADDAIEHVLDLWRREGSAAPWFRVGSVKFEELDEVDANILSFSEYALAW